MYFHSVSPKTGENFVQNYNFPDLGMYFAIVPIRTLINVCPLVLMCAEFTRTQNCETLPKEVGALEHCKTGASKFTWNGGR